MAIVKFGSLVVGVRGSIGGVTFSEALGGPYARSWGRSTNPRSRLQQRGRSHFGGLGAAWQALTPTERGDWDSLAAADPEPTFNSLGEPVTLSGWAYFVRCNTRRLQNSQELMPLAPTGAEAVQPLEPTVTNFEVIKAPIRRFRVDWDVDAYLSTDYGVAFVTTLPTGSPVYTPSVLRFIASEAADVGQLNAYDEYVAIFGLVQPDWTVSGNFYIQNESGLRSVPVKLLQVAV